MDGDGGLGDWLALRHVIHGLLIMPIYMATARAIGFLGNSARRHGKDDQGAKALDLAE